MHVCLARYHRQREEFGTAHNHYLRSATASQSAVTQQPPADMSQQYSSVNDASSNIDVLLYEEHAAMLLQWAEQGANSERDLFITRTVLQYMCLQDLKGTVARQLRVRYTTLHIVLWFDAQQHHLRPCYALYS